MYQGKHVQRNRKPRFRKSFVVLASVVVLMLGVVGGTLAFLTTDTTPVKNDFSYGHVSCTVEESFSEGTKSNVTIKNTGDTEAYIRAKVIVNWKDASGNVYGKQPVADTDYSISYGSGWTPHDGYWYCDSSVAAKGSTPVLITGCTEVAANRPAEGYALSVEIIADAVQSEPVSAVESAWGYIPGGN